MLAYMNIYFRILCNFLLKEDLSELCLVTGGGVERVTAIVGSNLTFKWAFHDKRISTYAKAYINDMIYFDFLENGSSQQTSKPKIYNDIRLS